MAIAIILGIILGVGALVLIGAGLVIAGEDDQFTAGTATSVIIGILLAIAFLIVPFSFHTVEAGEVAVVKQLGKAKEVKTAGTYWTFWMTNSYTRYDAKVQNVDITTMAYSSDAQTMDVQMTLQYNIMTDHAIDIATQYGNLDALETRIKSIAIEKAKSVLSASKAMDIIANRASLSPAVEEAIKTAIGDEYFVNVTAVVLTNIDFSDAFELAVEEKMIAEQAKLKADYENATKVAQAQAQIDIEKANAEALKIKAEAEAEANRIIAESITDDIIKKILAEKWDGKLPTVTGDSEIILPDDILN